MAQCVSRVELSVSCQHLLDRDVGSKSDPLCVLLQDVGGRQWAEVRRRQRPPRCGRVRARRSRGSWGGVVGVLLLLASFAARVLAWRCGRAVVWLLQHVLSFLCSECAVFLASCCFFLPFFFNFVSVFVQLDRTERIKNCQNPEFSKKLVVDYYFEKVQKLKFGVYDIDNKSPDLNDDDYLGGIECTLGQVCRGTREAMYSVAASTGFLVKNGKQGWFMKGFDTFTFQNVLFLMLI